MTIIIIIIIIIITIKLSFFKRSDTIAARASYLNRVSTIKHTKSEGNFREV
jgi:hypothetical protein